MRAEMKTNRQTVLKLRRWASALFVYLLSEGRSVDKRERILEEAEKLFSQKGYYGLSLSELLARCDIPKGSFYYYFPQGKIQLIQETLRYSYNKMVNGIRKNVFTQPTALATFESMAEHLARGVLGRRYFASLLLSMISIESVYLDKEIQTTCKEIYEDWQRLYAEHLAGLGFAPEESVTTAQAVFALIHGSMVSSWIKQDPTDLMLAKASLRKLIGDR